MSEGTETAAPTSTADIAASVIENAEQDAAASTESTETSRLDTRNTATENGTPPAEPAVKLSPAAEFLLKQGHTNKKLADGRDTRLPYGTVEKMLDRYLQDHQTTWTTERGTLESNAKTLQGYLDTLKASVAGDPKAFLSELAGIDPRYAAFLEQKREEARQAAEEPEPQPDYPIRDAQGNVIGMTFSLEGQKKREAWLTSQLRKEFQGTIEERFKPIAEREKAAQAQADRQRVLEANDARAAEIMKDVQTWAGFAEHKEEMLKLLQEDSAQALAEKRAPQLSVEGAYRKVVMAKLLEDDNKKRERLLAELNKAPKSPALARQTADGAKVPAVVSTRDIAARVIANANRQG